MGKTLLHPHTAKKNGSVLAHLRLKRRELERQMASVDSQIRKIQPQRQAVSLEQLDRLLTDLTDGLPALPPLPRDFSRADLYDDHD